MSEYFETFLLSFTAGILCCLVGMMACLHALQLDPAVDGMRFYLAAGLGVLCLPVALLIFWCSADALRDHHKWQK